jgi:hypothetical protein
MGTPIQIMTRECPPLTIIPGPEEWRACVLDTETSEPR